MAAKRGKPEVGEMASESTSEEDDTRCGTARAHSVKPGAAGKASPSHAGFCYFQIRFCFNVTSNPTKFQTLLHKKWWLGSKSIHLVEPQTQESWHTLCPACLCRGSAGDPLTAWLNLLLRSSLQCLSPLPGRAPTPWCCWECLLVPQHQNHAVWYSFLGGWKCPAGLKRSTWKGLKGLKSELPHWAPALYLAEFLPSAIPARTDDSNFSVITSHT